jgi:hypothetical protein
VISYNVAAWLPACLPALIPYLLRASFPFLPCCLTIMEELQLVLDGVGERPCLAAEDGGRAGRNHIGT